MLHFGSPSMGSRRAQPGICWSLAGYLCRGEVGEGVRDHRRGKPEAGVDQEGATCSHRARALEFQVKVLYPSLSRASPQQAGPSDRAVDLPVGQDDCDQLAQRQDYLLGNPWKELRKSPVSSCSLTRCVAPGSQAWESRCLEGPFQHGPFKTSRQGIGRGRKCTFGE